MGLYEQLEDEVIADIARRVKKTGRYTETAELMAKSMVEQGYSAQKIQAEVMKLLRADKAYQMAVAENTKAYKQEIQNIIDATVKAAKEAGDQLVAEAGNMAWNNDLSMWEEHGVDLKKPNTMSQLMTAFKAQTVGELRNLTKSMGFKNTVLGTTGVLNAYQREMDLALLKVTTGTFSYDQAVNDCVHRLAQSGLRSIDYANGRSYQLDTAARMSVRTGMSQLAGKIMEANLESTGQDLVITSQHMGSRPEHVPWQNKVFSYSGKSKKYPDFFKETGYGTATGLKGVNCTHDFYPFWEGSSIIPEDLKEPEPRTINGKKYTYYEATQQQRKMERNIRATKREIEAQNAIGGSTTELKSKLRKQTNEYKAFSNNAGLKVRDNRLRVASGTSNLSKKEQQDIKIVKPTNKNGEEIKFDFKGKDEKHLKQKQIITDLSNEYNTRLQKVTLGARGGAGDVDVSGVTMRLNDGNIFTAIHEFAHSIANTDADKYGLTQDPEFWKEIKKIRTAYRKDVGDNSNSWISSYEHSSKKLDEFFAEAFTQAKMKELGLEIPSKYGSDFTYSKQVLDTVNKYFGKETLETSVKSSTIELDILIHKSVGAKSKNYNIKLPDGSETHLTEGTRITNVQTIAGKGRERQIDEVDVLLDRYGGTESEWKKKKGIGYVDYQGESYRADLHWYEEATAGKHDWKVKPDADGNWFYDED